ncbi:MAG: DUF2835 family protein [Aestuariibacter sp.]
MNKDNNAQELQAYYFQLNVTYQECERLYMPGNNTCLMRAENGARIQVPSKNLRPFVTSLGIKGRFRLITDKNNKLKSFEKIA